MRIFLDAYFDNNFGDDLFISTVLQRYPQDLFYVFLKSNVEVVLKKAMGYPNLVVLPGQCELRTGMCFDGYIMVGGDVLPDGINYSDRIAAMRSVKDRGGFVAMLGFSLYESYGEKTREDLQTMAELADSIVPRDRFSAERFQRLVPGARITESTDMAFAMDTGISAPAEKDVLGISVRRKLYSTDQEHSDFCDAMAAIANAWLEARPEGKVRFLALSTGEYDDRITAADVCRRMAQPEKAEIAAHTGTVTEFLEKVRSCTAMVPTRFHALVFALIYGIPFVPVPYEVKLTQLLDEVGYSGVRIPYGVRVSDEMIEQAMRELTLDRVDQEALIRYQRKAEVFFEATDRLVEAARGKTQCGSAMICSRAEENSRLAEENLYLKGQVSELEKWVQSLQKERQVFDEALRDLSEKYTAATQTDLVEENKFLKTQVTELDTWVQSLQKERQDFDDAFRNLNEEYTTLYQESAQMQAENGYLKAQVTELENWVQSLQNDRQVFEEALRDLNEKYTVLYEKAHPIRTLIKRIFRR